MNISNVRVISDIHIEFHSFELPELETDSTSVLVLAGDIDVLGKATEFIDDVASRFAHVIYVLGNHEHFKWFFERTEEDLITHYNKETSPSNVTVAGNVPKLIVFDNIRFLAGTMWTDMNKSCPMTINICSYSMNDYRLIRKKNGEKLRAQDTIEVFNKTVSQFSEWLKTDFDGTTIIVSHHLPSFIVVDPEYVTAKELNGAYASDLDDFIADNKIDYWFFGHSHRSRSEIVYNTNIMSNPRGYPRKRNWMTIDVDFENPSFDPLFNIAI